MDSRVGQQQQQAEADAPEIRTATFTTISLGKTHAEYVNESRRGLVYLPHHLAGVREVYSHENHLRFQSIQDVMSFARREARHAVLTYRRGVSDFHLSITAPDEATKHFTLHTSIVGRNAVMAQTIAHAAQSGPGIIAAQWPINSPWITVRSLQFGVAMIMGQDPASWFQEANADQDVPKGTATSVRVSLQRMLLAIQFNATVASLQLPESYQELGLFVIQQELDWWNFELVLSYLLREHEAVWESSPLGRDFGTTFEPMDAIWKHLLGYTRGCPSPHSAIRIFWICIYWFRDNLPRDLARIEAPFFASAALGGQDHELHGGHVSDPSEEVLKYRHPLATLRIMSSILPEFVPNPDPEEIAIPQILPVILISIPYGILKAFLYAANLSIPNKYAFASIVCGWRSSRQNRTLQHFTRSTGHYLVWKRPGWPFYTSRDPTVMEWPIRNRYVEIPYLIKIRNDKGEISEVFDYKRYWYEWQIYTLEECTHIHREYVGNSEENTAAVTERGKITKLLIDDIMGVRRRVERDTEDSA